MGGQSSKVTYESVVNVITDVIARDVQDCSSYIMANQRINVSGSGNIVTDVTQVQRVSIDSQCYGRTRNNIDVQNLIMTQLDQYARTQGLAGFSALDRMASSNDISLTTEIRNNITIENIQKCIASTNAIQELNVQGRGNIVARVAQQQTVAQLKSCLSDNISETRLGTAIEMVANQSASTTATNPLQGIFDALNFIPNTLLYLIIGFVLLIVLYFIFGRSSSGERYPAVSEGNTPFAPVITQ